ncbi:3-phosphoglycerate kinase [Stutzerimonas azotifigens]|uniref:3-phosphoglycerate kinase n=1 Tax=Stutzerimonas azotifigens TaxID=291995 RepID=A0ABR5YWD0_9GAMM|nr:3-phosphoglycerate kinase [Stutzerimonas azotifigens]MBA1272223.1 3-phosphoglycerate kinase [Stutzerimonas azotifigens]
MKRFCCVLLALLPVAGFAATYPIEVEQKLNDAEISVTPQAIDRDMSALLLYNYGPVPVACTAVFRNGPESPRTRKAVIPSGAQMPMTVKFKRDVIRLRTSLTCEKQ